MLASNEIPAPPGFMHAQNLHPHVLLLHLQMTLPDKLHVHALHEHQCTSNTDKQMKQVLLDIRCPPGVITVPM